MRKLLVAYLQRHQHHGNRTLHAVGLPLSFLAAPLLLVQAQWLWATTAFVVGYVLQFAGHALEGNDAGEMVLIKKLLGRPYVAISPRTLPGVSRPPHWPARPQSVVKSSNFND